MLSRNNPVDFALVNKTIENILLSNLLIFISESQFYPFPKIIVEQIYA